MPDRILPKSIDIGRLDSYGARFEGTVPLATMRRLRELVLTPPGVAEAAIEVLFKEPSYVIVTGAVTAPVRRECQRCLEPKEVVLHAPFRLLVVDSVAEAEALGQASDPLVAPGGVIDLLGALEDELLLALPPVTRHEPGEVCEQRDLGSGASGVAEPGASRQSPFVVLEQFKKRSD